MTATCSEDPGIGRISTTEIDQQRHLVYNSLIKSGEVACLYQVHSSSLFCLLDNLLIASLISDFHQQPTFPSINMSNGQTTSIEQDQIQYWPESFSIHQNQQKFPSSPLPNENTLAHPVPRSLYLANSNFSSFEESAYPKREGSSPLTPLTGKSLYPVFRPCLY